MRGKKSDPRPKIECFAECTQIQRDPAFFCCKKGSTITYTYFNMINGFVGMSRHENIHHSLALIRTLCPLSCFWRISKSKMSRDNHNGNALKIFIFIVIPVIDFILKFPNYPHIHNAESDLNLKICIKKVNYNVRKIRYATFVRHTNTCVVPDSCTQLRGPLLNLSAIFVRLLSDNV